MAGMRIVMAALACGVALAGSGLTAQARTPYDGLWSVLVVTDRGTCDRAYRYPVRIANGRVHYDGEGSFTVSGGVGRGGAVSVSIRRGDQAANGRGRLTADAGSGNWSSPTGHCAGQWTAERR